MSWTDPEPNEAPEGRRPMDCGSHIDCHWGCKGCPGPLPQPTPRAAETPKSVNPFKWIGGAILPPSPKCPKPGCNGEVVYRRRDDSMWCLRHDEYFSYRSYVDILHAAGLWFL